MKKAIILVYAAFISATSCVAAFGCAAPDNTGELPPESGIVEESPPIEEAPPVEEAPPIEEAPPVEEEVAPPAEEPKPVMAEYVKVNAESVNIRSGAGTSYSVLGVAEKGNIYVYAGRSGN
ncbi:MAG: hypothetical protein ACI4MC_00070 [Candidatus Coproplasma sp.]